MYQAAFPWLVEGNYVSVLLRGILWQLVQTTYAHPLRPTIAEEDRVKTWHRVVVMGCHADAYYPTVALASSGAHVHPVNKADRLHLLAGQDHYNLCWQRDGIKLRVVHPESEWHLLTVTSCVSDIMLYFHKNYFSKLYQLSLGCGIMLPIAETGLQLVPSPSEHLYRRPMFHQRPRTRRHRGASRSGVEGPT